MEDLYSENCKSLKKAIEEDAIKLKDLLYSWNFRINIVKIGVLLKANYRFNVFLIIIMSFFTEIENPVLKFIWNHKRP
jgi:hypothetical protein